MLAPGPGGKLPEKRFPRFRIERIYIIRINDDIRRSSYPPELFFQGTFRSAGFPVENCNVHAIGSQLFYRSEAKTARAAKNNRPLIQKLFFHSPDVKGKNAPSNDPRR